MRTPARVRLGRRLQLGRRPEPTAGAALWQAWGQAAASGAQAAAARCYAPCRPAGATFQLIRGSREQRFKRIVLQETCLVVSARPGAAVPRHRRCHGGGRAGGGWSVGGPAGGPAEPCPTPCRRLCTLCTHRTTCAPATASPSSACSTSTPRLHEAGHAAPQAPAAARRPAAPAARPEMWPALAVAGTLGSLKRQRRQQIHMPPPACWCYAPMQIHKCCPHS